MVIGFAEFGSNHFLEHGKLIKSEPMDLTSSDLKMNCEYKQDPSTSASTSSSSNSCSSSSSARESPSSSGNDEESNHKQEEARTKRKRKSIDYGNGGLDKRSRMTGEEDFPSSSDSDMEAHGQTDEGDKGPVPEKGRRKRSGKSRHLRKNIKDVLKEDQLENSTKEARVEEMKRLQRLNELRKQRLEQAFLAQIQQKQMRDLQAEQIRFQQIQNSLERNDPPQLINLSSSSEDGGGVQDVKTKGSDSDDIKILSEEEMLADEEEDNEYDPNNSGDHVDDALNVPDAEGRVLVNTGHPEAEPDIFLPPHLAKIVKPHQIGGIRFLYDNIVESLASFNSSPGFGCILAHSMGLGKTIQIVTFCDIFLRHTPGKRVLCIVPINTIQNWVAEFNSWLPETVQDEKTGEQIKSREIKIHLLNDLQKSLDQKSKVILDWQQSGGVLLMGYELYRQLANKKPRKRKKKLNGPECIDIEEEDRLKSILDGIQMALVDPGPDLVVCDEGHRIKNSHASISQALKAIKTKRRIVLTGYPLQNNLMEYWCMVDFVRPDYLGTKTEFSNMFERPIQNGQCVDSTPKDVRLMMHRVHVLQTQLKGFVQRRSHSVLQKSLPCKTEHVFLLRLTSVQRQFYKTFIDDLVYNKAVSNPLKAFAVCCKIWNHPDVLYNFIKKKETFEDLDLDMDEIPEQRNNKTPSRGKSGAKVSNKKPNEVKKTAMDRTLVCEGPGFNPFGSNVRCDKREEINYDWANELMSNYIPGVLENSSKFTVFFSILEETIMAGDRLLLFSQSLLTLNLLEQFLQERTLPGTNVTWKNGFNYFRLDGSTPALEREKLISSFNAAPSGTGPSAIPLFIVSTRAGSLGINLVGANRVVVFDASWNPCHDAQAVCRVYRYGQIKQSHIYRFVTDNSIEKKIYDRQVNKQGMANRVVDEMNPDNHLSSKEINNLITDNEEDPPLIDLSGEIANYDDTVLQNVIKSCQNYLTKAPFTHESLLVDRKEKKLTKAEKRLAERSYQLEKGSKISYTRPSYSAYYPQAGMSASNLNQPGSNGFTRNRYFHPPVSPSASTPSMSSAYQPADSVRPYPYGYGVSASGMDPGSTSTHLGHSYGSLLHSSFSQVLESQPAPGGSWIPPAPTTSSHSMPSTSNTIPQGFQPPPSSTPSNSPTPPSKMNGDKKFPVEALAKQGVTMQGLVVPKDMIIPTKSPGQPPIALKKGQHVMVIKTPKGIYLRLNEKIVKIKLPPGLLLSDNGSLTGNGTNQDVVTISSSESSSEAEQELQSPAHQLLQLVAAAATNSSASPPLNPPSDLV